MFRMALGDRDDIDPGDVVAGVLVHGEIAPGETGATRFHNETIVGVLLGEAA